MSVKNFENCLSVSDFLNEDLQEIEKTIDSKSARKCAENAIEFLSLRKGIEGEIINKKNKNSVNVKTLTELKEFLQGRNEFILAKQDVRLSDGIYPVDEMRARISYIIEGGKRTYGILTIGRKDSKGRKLEFFLDFILNPQGFKIKIE